MRLPQYLSLTFGLIILAFGASVFAVARLVGEKSFARSLGPYAIYFQLAAALRIAVLWLRRIGILIVPSACVSLALSDRQFPMGITFVFSCPVG
jgi:hypothetical protein